MQAAMTFSGSRVTGFQVRQGTVLAKLGTQAQDWTVVAYDVTAAGLLWRFPKGFSPVDTRYGKFNNGSYFGAADDEMTTCQICGHPIKHRYYIQCNLKGIFMRVGSECIESYVNAMTPAEHDRWLLAKLAVDQPKTAQRVVQVMRSKGMPYAQAVVAVRAWNRAEKAFLKRYPKPDAGTQERHETIRALYWKKRHATAATYGESHARYVSWSWWMEHRVQKYAVPLKHLPESWEAAMKTHIAETVQRAMKKKSIRGY